MGLIFLGRYCNRLGVYIIVKYMCIHKLFGIILDFIITWTEEKNVTISFHFMFLMSKVGELHQAPINLEI
jgi:hypothetical protein